MARGRERLFAAMRFSKSAWIPLACSLRAVGRRPVGVIVFVDVRLRKGGVARFAVGRELMMGGVFFVGLHSGEEIVACAFHRRGVGVGVLFSVVLD